MRATLDIITEAVHAELAQADSWRRVFDTMDDAELLRFDRFLVRTEDELAFQAGSVAERFRIRATRMAQLEAERRTKVLAGGADK